MLNRKNIRIRDPFVLVDEKAKKYYLYGTTGLIDQYTTKTDFVVYESNDLENFSDPITIFDGKDFWADRDYWAPEVFKYNDKYYMFASFKSKDRARGTQILVSDSPKGTFKPISDYPVTPSDWQCLDGTLYVENGKPYIVFCREWLEVKDGRIYAMELSKDLKTAVGEPILLFSASENKYVTPFKDDKGNDCFVTDGPFLYKEKDKVVMLWSSTSNGVYCVLKAYADSITGKWTQCSKPVFSVDGGHCMIFKAINGLEKIALHYPNNCPDERAVFLDYRPSL